MKLELRLFHQVFLGELELRRVADDVADPPRRQHQGAELRRPPQLVERRHPRREVGQILLAHRHRRLDLVLGETAPAQETRHAVGEEGLETLQDLLRLELQSVAVEQHGAGGDQIEVELHPPLDQDPQQPPDPAADRQGVAAGAGHRRDAEEADQGVEAVGHRHQPRRAVAGNRTLAGGRTVVVVDRLPDGVDVALLPGVEPADGALEGRQFTHQVGGEVGLEQGRGLQRRLELVLPAELDRGQLDQRPEAQPLVGEAARAGDGRTADRAAGRARPAASGGRGHRRTGRRSSARRSPAPGRRHAPRGRPAGPSGSGTPGRARPAAHREGVLLAEGGEENLLGERQVVGGEGAADPPGISHRDTSRSRRSGSGASSPPASAARSSRAWRRRSRRASSDTSMPSSSSRRR